MDNNTEHTAEKDAMFCPTCGARIEWLKRGGTIAACPRDSEHDVPVGDAQAEKDAIVVALTTERARRGLSMREVAREAGVSPACVHSWEHGARTPSLHNLRAWARALGRDLALTRPSQPAMQGLTEKAADPAVSSGGVVDLLGAPQRSAEAAKAARKPVIRPAISDGDA